MCNKKEILYFLILQSTLDKNILYYVLFAT